MLTLQNGESIEIKGSAAKPYVITICSKLRLGEFSGGACFVTAGSIKSFDDADFVSGRRAASAT